MCVGCVRACQCVSVRVCVRAWVHACVCARVRVRECKQACVRLCACVFVGACARACRRTSRHHVLFCMFVGIHRTPPQGHVLVWRADFIHSGAHTHSWHTHAVAPTCTPANEDAQDTRRVEAARRRVGGTNLHMVRRCVAKVAVPSARGQDWWSREVGCAQQSTQPGRRKPSRIVQSSGPHDGGLQAHTSTPWRTATALTPASGGGRCGVDGKAVGGVCVGASLFLAGRDR